MATPSDEAALLEFCRKRVKSFAESKYNTNKYFSGKENPAFRRAAVLVPIFVKEGALHFLLTLRSEELPTFKGQVAFPGGKQEDSDKDIVETALREAKEEVGLSPEIVEVVAVLCPLVTRNKKLHAYVYPVIGIIKSSFELVINTSEVQTTFDVPLNFFLYKATHRKGTMTFMEKEIDITFFDYETDAGDQTKPVNFVIWGLTATICLKVSVAALNKLPEYQLGEYYPDLEKYIKQVNSQQGKIKCLSKV
ncbi:uncharacterized protein [Porites lutea]|uniref:uncharacterized protein n=1 Tax=Porites lutea TaxID=51062 RepID=UPI003CC53630